VNAGYSDKSVHTVGPQMFASLQTEISASTKDKIIGLFYTTPVNIPTLVQYGRGATLKKENFHIQFAESAFQAIKDVFSGDFKIIIKMKRPDDARHSFKLAKWTDNIKSVRWEDEKYFITKNADTNPWQVLKECDLVISIPYTSMSEAALALGKPACFFDPSGSLLPRPGDQVPLLSSQNALADWLQQYVKPAQNSTASETESFGPKKVASTLAAILSPQLNRTFKVV